MDNYNERQSGSARRIGMAAPQSRANVKTERTAAANPRRTPPRRKKKRGLSFMACLLVDVVVIGIFLLSFSYFHHVNPIFAKIDDPVTLPTPEQSEKPDDPPQVSAPVVTPDLPDDPEDTPPEVVEPAEPQHKFEDKFSDTVVHTDNQYINKNVNVTVTTVEDNGVIYHVADVYVRDVKYLQADFATDKGFGMTKDCRALIQDASKRVNAFVAINGDQCGQHNDGMVIRNGVLYRQNEKNDVCVLNYDGTLVTYAEAEFDTDATIAAGAWQVWTFGPELLDENGQPLKEFNTTVGGANPRSVIGMIEPLHYLLVTVDGRGESAGLTMSDLAKLMQDLGCTAAYNLDGGGTAAMTVNGEVYSTPSKVRSVYDIIYVAMED